MMEDFDPDIVCSTAVASQYPFINKIAAYTKNKWRNKLLIIGGPHTTLNPDEVINGAFDILCIGEGEYPLEELCTQLENNGNTYGIPNLWIKIGKGVIEKNPTRPFLPNLDVLPFPDRELWKPWVDEKTATAEWSVLLGRGCPYNCTYCSNHVLKKIAPGRYVRMRSPSNIIQEISSIHENYPESKRIFFEVEAIALDKEWAFELCRQIEIYNSTINNSIAYACNFRVSPQSIDENLFVAMRKANIKAINIGLESGSERVRQKILKRGYSNEDFLNVISLARKHSFKIIIYNMIGIPGETFDDHMETVLLNRLIQPDSLYTSIFFPYPATELYDICIEQKLINKQVNTRLERKQSVLNLSGFTKSQIQNAYTWFSYRVYKRHKSTLELLTQVIKIKFRSNPATNFLFYRISRLLQRIRNLIAIRKKSLKSILSRVH
jgi:radical SAM superfamily enzyme YgiQ (UPF0313 family)